MGGVNREHPTAGLLWTPQASNQLSTSDRQHYQRFQKSCVPRIYSMNLWTVVCNTDLVRWRVCDTPVDQSWSDHSKNWTEQATELWCSWCVRTDRHGLCNHVPQGRGQGWTVMLPKSFSPLYKRKKVHEPDGGKILHYAEIILKALVLRKLKGIFSAEIHGNS